MACDPRMCRFRSTRSRATLRKWTSDAARRASFYGSNSYQAVKNILTRALDLEPLPTSKAQPRWADAPRFARDLSKLFDSEGGNEHH